MAVTVQLGTLREKAELAANGRIRQEREVKGEVVNRREDVVKTGPGTEQGFSLERTIPTNAQ